MFGFFKSYGTSLTPDEAHAQYKAGKVRLVDVREVNEWRQARLPGAILMPLSTMSEIRLKEISDGKPIVFYCRSGARSSRAMSICRSYGLPHDQHVAGGIMAWARSGLPVES